MKPIFVVGGLYSQSNGVAWIMRDLAKALGETATPVDVYGADCIGRGAKSIGNIFEPPTRWFSGTGVWLGGLSWSPPTKRLIQHAVQNCDVVHNHSLWMLPNSYASQAAKRYGKPVMITAHGALEPWALEHSGWKKKIVGHWFQFPEIAQAQCIHVNSKSERDGIRKLGFTNPIAIIPNGINWEEYEPRATPDLFWQRYPELRTKRVALFLARLHKKKGLQHLLEAWGQLHTEFPQWHLVIAGPDNGYEQTVIDFIHNHRLEKCTTLTGPLGSQEKRSALAAAELFVQPSFSEGFSMSILEALASGKPALITPGCNFSEAADCGAAIEVTPDTEATLRGLQTLLSRPKEQLIEMGHIGRELIRSEYTWKNVAKQTLAVYSWLRNAAPKPSFVEEAL